MLVKWLIDEPPGGTWENRETLKDVEAFHHYCAANKLNAFLPRSHPLWEASMPSTQRRTAAQLKVPEPPQDTVIGPRPEKKKRKTGHKDSGNNGHSNRSGETRGNTGAR